MKKKIIIFGCGFHGRAAYRKCIRFKNKYDVVGWIDNDLKKKNKTLFNKKIYKPESLKILRYDNIILCGRDIDIKKKQIKKINGKKKILLWGNQDIRPLKRNILKRDKSLIRILNYLVNLLDGEKILYWADSSALLSIFRKENLSLRSDFDISINKKYIKKITKICGSSKYFRFHAIKNKNLKMKLFFTSNNNIFNYEPAVVDLCFKDFSKKKYIYNYSNTKKKFLKKFFTKFNYVKYKNIKLRVPFKSKEYLSSLYGNWKIKKRFHKNNLSNKKPYLYQPFIQ